MADPRIERIREKRRKERSSLIWHDIREMLTGRVGAASSDNPTTGLSAGYIWVHGDADRPEVPALNPGRVTDRVSNARVLVGERWSDGLLEIITVEALLNSITYGGAIGAIATPSVPPELQPGGGAFAALRLRAYGSGALSIVADAGWYTDTTGTPRYWQPSGSNALDLSGYVPAAVSGVNQHCWVAIDLNRDANTPMLVATAGTAQAVSAPLTPADLEAIALTNGYWRLGAVRLATGATDATALTTDDWLDTRHWLLGGTSSSQQVAHTFTSQSLAADGVWTWFNDPRAVTYNGKTYVGFITSTGDVQIVSYDHATATASAPVTLSAALEVDDHDNPSILIRDSDKRIMVFYAKHADTTLRLRVSTNPEDISAWGSEQSLDANVGLTTYAYTNPLQLTGETGDPIYLIFRHFDSLVTSPPTTAWYYTKSTNDGTTWSAGTSFWKPGSAKYPYVRVYPTSATRFDVVATNAHPAHENPSVYHFYYEGGNWYKSDGTQIVASLPLTPADVTLVYDGTTTPAWVWDITVDADGNPWVLYATFPTTSDHRYNVGRWTGSAWTTAEICAAGGYLYAAQEHYSGGVAFDHDNPRIVYASREISSQFELWKYTTDDDGATWSGVALTSGSAVKNIRPIVPRDAEPDLKVIWLRGTYTTYEDYALEVYGGNAADETQLTQITQLRGVKALVESFEGTTEAIALGYATDTEELGVYTGGAWVWFGDEKTKISANDTTAGYLNGKLVAGDNITLTENTDGGNETLTIAVTSSFTNTISSTQTIPAGHHAYLIGPVDITGSLTINGSVTLL